MANGEDLKDRVEYESLIKSLQPEERSIRIAMQLYDLTVKVESNSMSKKMSAVSGGVSGTVMAIVIGIIEYFRNR